MAAVTSRRKATTYGKAHRKPFIDSTFAVDGMNQFAWSNKASLEASLEGDSMLREKLAMQHKGPSGQAQPTLSPKHNPSSLYDLPSSDDELNAKKVAPVVRKRRKITPSVSSNEESPVFDDDSLQRHIAAEVGKRMYMDAGRKAEKARGHPRNKNHRTESHKPRFKGNTRTEDMAGKRIQGYTPNVPVPKDPMSSVPVVKPIRCSAQDIGREITPSNDPLMSPSPTSSTSRKEIRYGQTLHPHPRTPPRPTSAHENKGTTPRQRDMWNRLLADNYRSASPSHFNLPELNLTEPGTGNSSNFRDSIYPKRSIAPHPRINTQSKRVVHQLLTTNCVSNPSEPGLSDVESEPQTIPSSDDSNRSQKSADSSTDCVMTIRTSPSSASQVKNTNVAERFAAGHAPETLGFQTSGLKVTYGQQRSYLTDHSVSEAEGFMQALEEEPDVAQPWQQRFKSSLPRTQNEMGIDYDLEDGPDSQNGAMRSIHELRQAGGNVRLIGEFETALDELDELDGQPSARRVLFLDLAAKFRDSARCRLFVDRGLEARLLQHFNIKDDIITKSISAALLLRLLVNSKSTVFLSQTGEGRIRDFLVGLFGEDADLASAVKERQFNISKVVQQDYKAFCQSLLESTIWRSSRPTALSGKILSLQCLEYYAKRKREEGTAFELLTADQVESLVETAVPTATFSSNTDPATHASLQLALVILESSSIGKVEEGQAPWSKTALHRIANILPILTSLPKQIAEDLELPTLRLYLNITNAVPRVSEMFIHSGVVETIFDIIMSYFTALKTATKKDQSSLLDRVILSLGCLINFAEVSDVMRRLTLDSRVREQSILVALLDLFKENRRKAAQVSLNPPPGSALSDPCRLLLKKRAHRM